MQKNNTTVKAINKNVRSSPRKLALVLNYIKGKKADLALRDLEFTRKRIAQDVSKTVKSAISNAENNHQFDIDIMEIQKVGLSFSVTNKCSIIEPYPQHNEIFDHPVKHNGKRFDDNNILLYLSSS